MILKRLFSLTCRAGKEARLSILIFHRVHESQDELYPSDPCVNQFDKLLSSLKRWFNIIPLDEAIRHLSRGTLPPRSLCITFDDGYTDNFLLALPILKKHNLTATFFIASGFIDNGIMFNDIINESIRNCDVEYLDLSKFGYGVHKTKTTLEKRKTINTLIGTAKYLALRQRSDFAQIVLETSKAKIPEQLMMTRDQIIGLKMSGMIIGGHTRSHPILARISRDQAEREISDGRDDLESIIGEKIHLFAYPNGKPGEDYLQEHVEIVKRLNFLGAVSTAWGVSTQPADLFQLPRFTPWDTNITKFGLRLVKNISQTEFKTV